ncbi:hypothetical protein H0H92_005185 [Tricholoma furcatifolium]|nr:hypothetical protein H0H92_005185 [Tricholoma furcatifolium]
MVANLGAFAIFPRRIIDEPIEIVINHMDNFLVPWDVCNVVLSSLPVCTFINRQFKNSSFSQTIVNDGLIIWRAIHISRFELHYESPRYGIDCPYPSV